MEQTNDINLYDNILVLNGSRLTFDENILYDFEDRYHNVSALSMESQLQTFSNLVKMIYGSTFSHEKKAEAIIIFASIFATFSAQNHTSHLVGIGENDFNDLFAYVLSLFGNDNLAYTISHKSIPMPMQTENRRIIAAEDYSSMNGIEDKMAALILVNLDEVMKDTGGGCGAETDRYILAVLNECYRITASNGKILCYASGIYDLNLDDFTYADTANLYQLGNDCYLLDIDICSKEPSECNMRRKKQVLDEIGLKKSKLDEYLNKSISITPVNQNDPWYRQIDKSIFLVSQIEEIVRDNFELFDDMDLKYLTNELKNALLDLKYEMLLGGRHIDFFQSILSDCYTEWADGLR